MSVIIIPPDAQLLSLVIHFHRHDLTIYHVEHRASKRLIKNNNNFCRFHPTR